MVRQRSEWGHRRRLCPHDVSVKGKNDSTIGILDCQAKIRLAANSGGHTVPCLLPCDFVEAAEFRHFLSKSPHVQLLSVEGGDGDFGIALLAVEHAELIEEVDFSPRSGFERVEPLQPGLEAKRVGLEGKWHPPAFWRDDLTYAVLGCFCADACDVCHGVQKLLRGGVVGRTFWQVE